MASSADSPGLARGLHRPWLLLFPAVALVVTVVSLIWAGSADATALNDPGPVVRWGGPLAETLMHLGIAVAIGSLLFAVGLLPRYALDAAGKRRRWPQPGRAAREENAGLEEYEPFTAALNLGAIAALTWTISGVAALVFSYANISGSEVSPDEQFAAQLLSFMQDISAGQTQSTVVIVGAVVTTLIFGVRSLLGLLLTLGVSFIALIALALAGHSSGGDDHMGAVNSVGLHLLGVCLWVGGLVVLAYLSRSLTGPQAGTGTLPERRRGSRTARGRRAPMAVAVLHRYSTVALGAFILVGVSGLINAGVRVHGWQDLGTAYGMLLVAKAVLMALLGIAGAVHRVRLFPRMDAGQVSAFGGIWRVIAVEVVLMAAVMGVATTLSGTAPPVSEELAPGASPARIITWYELPPEPQGMATWLGTWRFDWFWVAVVVFLAWVYLWAFARVRARGGQWSGLRLGSWMIGLLVLTYATSGAFAVYARVLFSVHMMEHMTLTMIIPIFLVLGAPVTLLLKALEPRQDGTRGPREWILRLVHSTWSRIITNPVFAGINFAGSLVFFYFTPMFGVALRYHVGHEFMMVHFLFTGYIFALVLIGIDPIPKRPAYPFRLVMLIATLGYHAFVGIAIMTGDALLQASWFGNLGRGWGASAIDDQHMGGAFMWALGEIPTMIIAVIVAVQWSRAGEREAKRIDRQADRDDDAELRAYNEMFERLQQRDRG